MRGCGQKLAFGGEGRVGGVDVEDVRKKETSFKLMSSLKRENRERERRKTLERNH